MILTEEEAKTKWCPEVRAGAPFDSVAAGTSINRWPHDNSPTDTAVYRCIGSDCMAWREVREMQMGDNPNGDDDKTVVIGGYCGKAGKP